MWRFLRKLGIDPPYDTAIPLLGIFPNGPKSEYYSNACISMFIAAQFIKCYYCPHLQVVKRIKLITCTVYGVLYLAHPDPIQNVSCCYYWKTVTSE